MSIRPVLGSRASIGGPLGSGRGGAAALPAWAIAGGVSAANVVACYAPRGAASQSASYINLANPGTYDATPGTAPAWNTATGWTFTEASSQYLTTGLQVSNPCTIIVRVTRSAGNYRPIIVQDGYRNANGAGIAIWTQISWFVGNYGNKGQLAATTYPKVFAVQNSNYYVDGTSVANPGTGWTPSGMIEISRGYFIDVAGTYYGSAIITELSIYNATLSAAQVAAISAAMAAL